MPFFIMLYCTKIRVPVVVSIAKKILNILICGSGSSIMSTVFIAFTDSTKVLEQDYIFTKRIKNNTNSVWLICVTNSLLIVKASVV